MQTIKELQTEIKEFFAAQGLSEDYITGKFKDIFFHQEVYSDDQDFVNKFEWQPVHFEGGEGEGDYAESVFRLKGRYFRVTASYASYDGFYINDIFDWEEVEPVGVTVTQYKKVKHD
jgi:hypothetical protein